MNYKYNKDDIHLNFANEIKYFKEEYFFQTISIPSEKPDIENICDIFIQPSIVKTKLIPTDKGLSNEGQLLLGNKLIVEICLNQKVTYIAEEPTQSIYAITYEMLKSMFIILPENINEKSVCDLFKSNRLTINPYIEHCYIRKLDKRNFNTSILVLLDVQFC